MSVQPNSCQRSYLYSYSVKQVLEYISRTIPLLSISKALCRMTERALLLQVRAELIGRDMP